ncbi:MAG: FtsX-like permease family protein [Planctomycetes bacterium]|nr:FtsX-like permease family protein [Planctomycetota bacterium]
MSTLGKKLRRDLGKLRGQAVAIGLIVACGVAAWVCVLHAYRGLQGTRDAYYREYRMADLFAHVKKAPLSVVPKLSAIPGVRRVRARIAFDVTIDLPDVPEPCRARVLSLPDVRQTVVNDVHLVSGSWFNGDGHREVILGDRFAREHRLKPGDRLRVVMNNRKEALTIVATALAPEYVYMLRGKGDILPDPKHFTVVWFSTTFAESVFDFEDAANDFAALLDRTAILDRAIEEFDLALDRYGAYGAYGLKDQLSNRFLSDEIESLKGTATLVPTVFLGVAAFVLHMLLSRLVRTQRTEIAVFRAFGYPTSAIARHYVSFALVIVSAGAAAGTGIGLWFAKVVLADYARFYQFPMLVFRADPVVIASGVGVSLLFAVLGALSAALRAARLAPAEGLQPEPPGIFHRTALERWRPFWRRIGFTWRMVFRSVWRSRRRAAVTVFGVALSGSIILLARFSFDSLTEMIDHSLREVNREHVRVTFNSERGVGALHELSALPGVRAAEPELAVPVSLRAGHRERRLAILGLDPTGELRTLRRLDGTRVPRPSRGLVLTQKLAELLGVGRGDVVEVKVLDGRRPVFPAEIESVVDEYLGALAFADRHWLGRRIGEEDALNGARLSVDGAARAELTAKLKNLPAVESVIFKDQTRAVFHETLMSSMGIMTFVLGSFAGTIAFGVIYNASRIALSEKERSLATLRVLGFTRREVGAVVRSENLLLALLAIPLGIGLGIVFSIALARVYDNDLYRFPVYFRPAALLLTAAAVLVFTFVANLAVGRRLKRLDLVEVLKSRE